MANNFSDVGFVDQSGAELERLGRKCFENGRANRCEQGLYIRWEIGNGVEIWAQFNKNEELLGLNPFFNGQARASVGLAERVVRAGMLMDGGFKSVAQPEPGLPSRGAFPFVFDCPDFLLYQDLRLPLISLVQFCAFAQQCFLFRTEAEFQARSAGKLGNGVFIPLGLSGQDGAPLAEPLASAMLVGRVDEARLLVNQFSKHKFWRLKLANNVGGLDVVAAPELLSRAPKTGDILQCSAWLFGRISSEA